MPKAKPLVVVSIFVLLFFVVLPAISQVQLEWVKCASLSPAPGLSNMATANGKLYVFPAASSGAAPVYEYDPATDTWSSKTENPQGCQWASATTCNNKIYLMGGGQSNPPGKTYNNVYDPATDTWSAAADLLDARMYHSATAYEGKIYIFGGQNGNGTTEWYFDEFNTETNTWTRKANLPNNLAWYSGAAALNGKVFRIAGGGSSPTLIRNNIDMYDIATDTWSSLDSFPYKVHYPQAVVVNDKIYVLGGLAQGIGYTDSVWEFSFDDMKFHTSLLPNLPVPRAYHEVAAIGNTIYLFGGYNSNPEVEEMDGTLYKLNLTLDDVEEINHKLDLSLSIQNNIIDKDLFLTIQGKEGDCLNLRIINTIGGVEYSQKIQSNGKEFLNIKCSDLSDGLYFVTLSNPTSTITKKIIKIK